MTDAVHRHVRWRRGSSIDAEVARTGAIQLALWQEIDRAVATGLGEGAGPVAPSPWLTDAETDLSWLATPWSTIRKLTGAATDDEARAQARALAEPAVS